MWISSDAIVNAVGTCEMYSESDRALGSDRVSSCGWEKKPSPMETGEEERQEVVMSSRRDPKLGHGKDTLRRNWYFIARD